MSVLIKVIGADKQSDEYQAAEKLYDIIMAGLPKNCIGEVLIYASATLIGQKTKDVDLILMGILQNYSTSADFVYGDEEINGDVMISSFCTTIEIKSHDINGITRQGTDWYVPYASGQHCVTTQSNNQKYALKNYFEQTLGYSPYITNIIWFINASELELNQMKRMPNGNVRSNVMGYDISLRDIMQLIIWQAPPSKKGRFFYLDSCRGKISVQQAKGALDLFSQVKAASGELTRKRIEQMTSKNISSKTRFADNGQLLIYRGRAGTGKTVGLIQIAIRIVDEYDARALMLTYNRALVSDIRRLFSFAELPDMFEDSSVMIMSMQSYFYKLASQGLFDGKLDGDYFLRNYENILQDLYEMLLEDSDSEWIKAITSNDELNWDYVLIDEAQDWMSIERDIILKIFHEGKIIVADGGQQFVRRIKPCDWSSVKLRQTIKLKTCLRQKNNLVNFCNHFSETISPLQNRIIASEKMPGGRILIIEDKTKIIQVIKEERKRLETEGNIPYDLLMFVPPSMVENAGKSRRFRNIDEYERAGIYLWDGTNEYQRSEYSIRTDESRVLQYDSARGLEAWTVVCMDYDEFLDYKRNDFHVDEGNRLLLESPQDTLNKYMINWALLPLTRAIDTIVLTLKDLNSETAQILKGLSRDYPDYVFWI